MRRPVVRLRLFEWQDLRYAIRALRRVPGFTAAVVVSLALGIGANAAVFGAIYVVLFPRLPYRDPDRLVKVAAVTRDGEAQARLSAAEFLAARALGGVFEDTAATDYVTSSIFHVTDGTREPERLVGLGVTPNFFRLLGVRPVLGRDFHAAESSERDRVVLISEDLWRDRFAGSPSILEQPIALNGETYTVIGVVAADQWLRRPNLKVYVAIDPGGRAAHERAAVYSLDVYARLRSGTTLEQAQAAAEAARRHDTSATETRVERSVRLIPARETVFPDRQESYDRLRLLQAAVAGLLLIACGNVANLLLVRATARRREFAVRRALGASGARLIRQLFLEASLLGGLGGAVGLLLSAWGTALLSALWAIDLSLAREPRALALTALSVLAAVTLVSLPPAWHALRQDVADGLRHDDRAGATSRQTAAVQHALVVVEIGLSLAALVCAGLFIESAARRASSNPGFETKRVLLARTHFTGDRYRDNSRREEFVDEALARIEALPGVLAAAVVDWYPPVPAGLRDVGAQAAGRAVSEAVRAKHRSVTAGYFRTLGVPIVRGRDFDPLDRRARPGVAIINDTLAERFWPGQDPVGQAITVQKDRTTPLVVVGVVKTGDDNLAFRPEPRPEVVELSTVPSESPWFMVRTASDPLALTPSLRRAVFAVDRNQPVAAIRTLDGWIALEGSGERTLMRLLVTLALLAILLAAVGVYGTFSDIVARRRREIGVRLALGAQPAQMARLVLRRAIWLAAIGLMTGAGVALVAARAVSSLLYGVATTNATIFVAATLILLAAALLAAYLPARQAARVEPAGILRGE